jgi:hypothetical protein
MCELEVCRSSPYKTCALPLLAATSPPQTVDESFGMHALIGPLTPLWPLGTLEHAKPCQQCGGVTARSWSASVWQVYQ